MVIVEGARAVGKTRLVQTLVESGHIAQYVTLTDPETLLRAQSDIKSWLRALRQPFVIDEAQQLPELPLALKHFLDENADQISCVLTGSAALGRQGFGGSDPLTRRAMHLRLEPLTEAELFGEAPEAWSVVDKLFTADPWVQHPNDDGAWWRTALVQGGMPKNRLSPRPAAGRLFQTRVRSEAEGIVTDDVLPGERFDRDRALTILEYVVQNPAGEINAEAISRAADSDPRTVQRYLDILERRFLIHELRNLQLPKKKSTRSTAKAYPADIALSPSFLNLEGIDDADDMARGGLLEAFVVQQIRAHATWAECHVQVLHWRSYRNKRTVEVDIVLRDARRRLVGIEVKSYPWIRSDTFHGLKALREKYPDHFHRGYVIAPGMELGPYGEGMWTLPLDTLRDPSLWEH
ncbi:ATP-binding protein [Nesterenkonia ebinurensis]|uniref:ATP-binding protein n=1 Tax=Nesterenkonia ebinurensis TaxID=2608252 RepID=UPI00123D6D85|nr:DUF4143 domain-containing protein [Nesterenkonia ebinurensis]